ncbi:MAG: hypothetical protein ACKN9P_13525 [Phenylobacterium sp.]
MPGIAALPAGLDVGAVFSQAVATLRSKPLFFVFTGLMIGAFSLLGANLPVYLLGLLTGVAALDILGYPHFFALRILETLVAAAMLQVLAVRATEGPAGGDARTEFGPAVWAALPKLLPALATSLMAQVVVGLGLLLLVFPMVFFAVVFSLSTVACILEDRSPLAALKRSRELTWGNRWRVLGLLVILALVALGVILLVEISSAISDRYFGPGGLAARFLRGTAYALLSVFQAIVLTHAFLDLRRLRDELANPVVPS